MPSSSITDPLLDRNDKYNPFSTCNFCTSCKISSWSNNSNAKKIVDAFHTSVVEYSLVPNTKQLLKSLQHLEQSNAFTMLIANAMSENNISCNDVLGIRKRNKMKTCGDTPFSKLFSFFVKLCISNELYDMLIFIQLNAAASRIDGAGGVAKMKMFPAYMLRAELKEKNLTYDT